MLKQKLAGYDEKVQFVKQFLCNGPELDVDTIIHYRNIILDDEEYSEIANDFLADMTVIDDIRVNEFGKDTAATSDNCFLNPCNYLDNLSVNLGMMGDPANFATVKNLLALIVKKFRNKQTGEENPELDEVNDDAVNGNIRSGIQNRLPEPVRKGYIMLNKNIMKSYEDFGKKLANSSVHLDLMVLGDYNAIRISNSVSTMVKSNIFSLLGDCGRVWNTVRSLNYYKPEQNTCVPAPESANIGEKTITGLPAEGYNNPTDDRSTSPGVATVTYEAGEGPNDKDAETIAGAKDVIIKDVQQGSTETPQDEQAEGVPTDATALGEGADQPATTAKTPAELERQQAAAASAAARATDYCQNALSPSYNSRKY